MESNIACVDFVSNNYITEQQLF